MSHRKRLALGGKIGRVISTRLTKGGVMVRMQVANNPAGRRYAKSLELLIRRGRLVDARECEG